MRILILAVGRLKDGPERDLVARYVDRARSAGRALGFADVEVSELPESRAQRPADRKAEEAHALAARCAGWTVMALDERGAHLTSEAFAERLGRWRDDGTKGAALVIGGADGLDPAFAAAAAERLAFGRMTLPHQIVRILAAEQVYRAMTILAGHPYHRA
ncbi:MAG: 23S rRNA (pseudouridine(1915)-N(3))-methyltransferase RlmH [Alsobacter sp.]